MMASCQLLSLPQELRDLIYEFALSRGQPEADDSKQTPSYRSNRLPFNNARWEWDTHYPCRPPACAYLSLVQCNRQLHREVYDFVCKPHEEPEDNTAELSLVLSYPLLTSTWAFIPGPLERIKNLEILVKVDHMYHPAYMTAGPHNAILTAVFDVLKRYIHPGVHLAKPSELVEPLHLDTVRITLAPPEPFEDMTHVYGFPAQQLESLFNEFKALMCSLGRSGLPFPHIDAFEVQVEGKDCHRILVTSNIWDEGDYMFLQNGGYQWDAGNLLV